MNYLHHILQNAGDSQAQIYYKIGEHFFPVWPIHKQSAKFYFIKFEGEVYSPPRVSGKI